MSFSIIFSAIVLVCSIFSITNCLSNNKGRQVKRKKLDKATAVSGGAASGSVAESVREGERKGRANVAVGGQ